MKKNVIPWLLITISLFLLSVNTYSLWQICKRQESEEIYNKYRKISCTGMKAKFKTDMENGELKYFSVGMFESPSLTHNLSKYNIDNYHQGCFFFGNLNCYNELVEDFLNNKYHLKISELE